MGSSLRKHATGAGDRTFTITQAGVPAQISLTPSVLTFATVNSAGTLQFTTPPQTLALNHGTPGTA